MKDMAELRDVYGSLRRCGTPLIGIRTPDAEHLVAALRSEESAFTDKLGSGKLFVWDWARGLLDASGTELGECAGDPVGAVNFARGQESGTVVYFVFADLWLKNDSIGPVFIQALYNARADLKFALNSVVLLGPSLVSMPSHLSDVVMLHEPRPSADDIRVIIDNLLEASGAKASDENVSKSIDAVMGLTAFQAEQAVAVSLKSDRIDMDRVWAAKREQVRQTPGLSIYDGKERFGDIGGCDAIKDFLKRILTGNARPRGIVFVDEIEKAMAGAGGDTSGVSTDQLGVLLQHMQDRGAVGMIFVGVPGAAKSAISKAAGNEADIPTIQLDLGGLKGSLVGQSEAQIREALSVINGICDGAELWIATSNSLESIRPELKRRFSLGTYYFDLPDAEERAKIWQIYAAKYKLDVTETPADDGWTGDEIRRCCDIAWRLGCSVKESARYIVPVSVSGRATIETLRSAAEGKWISASTGEVYRQQMPPQKASGRRVVGK